MVFKVKITRYIDKPQRPPIKLKIERVLDIPKKTKRVYKKKNTSIIECFEKLESIGELATITETSIIKTKRKYTRRKKSEEILSIIELNKDPDVKSLPENCDFTNNIKPETKSIKSKILEVDNIYIKI